MFLTPSTKPGDSALFHTVPQCVSSCLYHIPLSCFSSSRPAQTFAITCLKDVLSNAKVRRLVCFHRFRLCPLRCAQHLESHDGATISRADWRHLRTLCGRNSTWRKSRFLVILLLIYCVTRRRLTVLRNALLGTIALSGDVMCQGTTASWFITFLNSVAFINVFLSEALTREQSGQPRAVTRARHQKENKPTTYGTEAPLLPDILRDIPDETVKALVT